MIAALEAGVKPWSCPWQRVPGMSGLPSNFATGIAYSGMNIMLLWCSASKQGFGDSRWMTYKQAQAVGGRIRKGEHGTTAIFYTTLEKENEYGEIDQIPMLKTFNVFNLEQIDGLPLTTETVSPQATFDPLPEAENLFHKSGANIIEKGQNAFSVHQPMKSGCRSVTFFLMPPISMPLHCMSWCTGVVVEAD